MFRRATVPGDVNNLGQVVGWSQTFGDLSHAFLYEDETMTDLNDLIDPNLDFTLFGATAINDSGQIAAYGKYGSDELGQIVRLVLFTPIPEPSVIALLVFVANACLGRVVGRRRS